MSFEATKYTVPESIYAVGPQLSFDFSFLNKITDELPDNFHFIELIQAVSQEIKTWEEDGSVEVDAKEIIDAVKFLQQEAQAALIAFNNKNSIIKL